jgi:hypothetical protein
MLSATTARRQLPSLRRSTQAPGAYRQLNKQRTVHRPPSNASRPPRRSATATGALRGSAPYMVVKGRSRRHRPLCLCCAESGAMPFSLRRAVGDAGADDTWTGLDDDEDADAAVRAHRRLCLSAGRSAIAVRDHRAGSRAPLPFSARRWRPQGPSSRRRARHQSRLQAWPPRAGGCRPQAWRRCGGRRCVHKPRAPWLRWRRLLYSCDCGE